MESGDAFTFVCWSLSLKISSVRFHIFGVKLIKIFSLLLNTVLSPAEADTAEDQDQPNLPTVSSKDVMKLSLVEDNTVILQVEEDRSVLPRKKETNFTSWCAWRAAQGPETATGNARAKEKKASDGNSSYRQRTRWCR